ncbi:MAG: DNA methyltransferase, partial [Planctomycetota bacterium]
METFTNEFWTAKQRDAHSLHEVSYRACFKPQLPAFFIERLTEPGGVVYDPFMGRGTTVLEAALLGRTSAGNDANPLSRILVEPRLDPPAMEEVEGRLREIDFGKGAGMRGSGVGAGLPRPCNKSNAPIKDGRDKSRPCKWPEAIGAVPVADLLVFYHPDTLREIVALRAYLLRREQKGKTDRTDRWIRMVATNRLTGHSPGFFSVYTMPPNQAVSAESQRKINRDRKQAPPYRNVAELILKKSRALLKDCQATDVGGMAPSGCDGDINRARGGGGGGGG